MPDRAHARPNFPPRRALFERTFDPGTVRSPKLEGPRWSSRLGRSVGEGRARLRTSRNKATRARVESDPAYLRRPVETYRPALGV